MSEKQPRSSSFESRGPVYCDPVIELYKRDVDRTLLRANLRLSVAERFEQFANFAAFAMEMREAGERARVVNSSASQ